MIGKDIPTALPVWTPFPPFHTVRERHIIYDVKSINIFPAVAFSRLYSIFAGVVKSVEHFILSRNCDPLNSQILQPCNGVTLSHNHSTLPQIFYFLPLVPQPGENFFVMPP